MGSMNEMERQHEEARGVAVERNHETFSEDRTMNPSMGTSRSRARRSRGRKARSRGDGGAVLVEFAIVVPIFFLLIFGIMEFGWAFFQKLDVRSGANEGARLAAVNYKTTAAPSPADQASQIVAETCDRMGSGDSDIRVEITRGSGAIGEEFVVTVHKQLNDLTGFFGALVDGKDIDESVHGRIEQTATWSQPVTNPLGQACP